MKNFILSGLFIFCYSCYNTSVDYKDPDCNSSFEPYELNANLYPVVEDEDDSWDYKRYYVICRDNLVVDMFRYNDFSKIIFSPNSVSQKGYLRIAESEVSESDYPDYYNLAFDSILLVHQTIKGRPDFLNLYSLDFQIEEPPVLLFEFDISRYQLDEFSSHPYNASLYDVGIYQVDREREKVLKKISDNKAEIIGIEDFSSLSGMVTAELTELGTYVAGIPISKAYQPSYEGGFLALYCQRSSEQDTIYYLSDYNGALFIDPFQEEAYTEIYLKNTGTGVQQGHAQIVFYGNSAGSYPLNSRNYAFFSYIEEGEIKTINTTGANGEIVISSYEPAGGLINGNIVMPDPSGAVDLDGNQVMIHVEFSVMHKLI